MLLFLRLSFLLPDILLMEKEEIPQRVWDSALNSEGEGQEYHRLDVLWTFLRSAKNPDVMPRFLRLGAVAEIVLVLPHSNAQEERVFSMMRKNKTAFRPNLKLDGTLQNIITVKLANPEPCHEYEPEKSVLDAAKKSCSLYNRAHTK